MRNSTPGAANGVYIESLTLTSAPLPSAAPMSLALIAALAILRLRPTPPARHSLRTARQEMVECCAQPSQAFGPRKR